MMDPKLEKVLRLYQSTQFDGEKASARARVEAMLAGSEMTFFDALDTLVGLDRHPECTPGAARKWAAEQRQFAERRDDLVRRFGSLEAAAAPTDIERAVQAALVSWIEMPGPDDHGMPWDFDDMPEAMIEAAKNAWPWPSTHADAVAELEMWGARENDLNAIAGERQGCPFCEAAGIRMIVIREHVDHLMAVNTAAGILYRLGRWRAHPRPYCDYILDAVERDLAAMAQAEAQPSTSVHTEPTLDDLLKANPDRSDRDVARQMGCSPTTVGKARARLGLNAAERSVQRGGQAYKMKRRGVAME